MDKASFHERGNACPPIPLPHKKDKHEQLVENDKKGKPIDMCMFEKCLKKTQLFLCLKKTKKQAE